MKKLMLTVTAATASMMAFGYTGVGAPPKDLASLTPYPDGDAQPGAFRATANHDAYTLSSDIVFRRINFDTSNQDPVILNLCGHTLTVNGDGAAASAFRTGNNADGSGTRVVITNGTVRQVYDLELYPTTDSNKALVQIGNGGALIHDFKVEVEKGGVLDAYKLQFTAGTNNVLHVRNGGEVKIGNGGMTIFNASSFGHLLQIDAGAKFDKYFESTITDNLWRPVFGGATGCCVSLGNSTVLETLGVTQIQPPNSGSGGSGNILELRGSAFNFKYTAPTTGTYVYLYTSKGSVLKVSEGAVLDFDQYRFWHVDSVDSQFIVKGKGSTVKSTNNSAFNCGYNNNAKYVIEDGGLLDLPSGEWRFGVAEASAGVSNLSFIVRNGGVAKINQFMIGYDSAKNRPRFTNVTFDDGSFSGAQFLCPNSSLSENTVLTLAGTNPKVKAKFLYINNPTPATPTKVVFDIPAGGYAEAPLETTGTVALKIEAGVEFEFKVADTENFSDVLLAKSNAGFNLGEGVLAAMNEAVPKNLNARVCLKNGNTELHLTERHGLCLIFR